MQTKGPNPVKFLQGKNAAALVEAYFEFNQLKRLFRQGWLRRGVDAGICESVAEHTLGVAVLAIFLVDAHFPDLDAHKALRMALLHDFGEIYAGDIVPSDAVGTVEKHRQERLGVEQVLGKLPKGAVYLDIWEEFEAGQTAEARLVRQLDRLEMALQASVYEQEGELDLQEFIDSALEALSAEELLALMQSIEAVRS